MNQPLLILALLVALSCCATSPAQQSRSTAAVQSKPGYSQLTISGDHGSLVVIGAPNSQFTVLRDGEVLPGERVRREDDHLRILDEAGATLYDIRVLPGGGLVFPYDAKVATSGWAGVTTMPGWTGAEPRKIIGVMVDPVDGTLASQLDIDPESAFVISSVSPGLPASKAGLQPHDVVVSIEGEERGSVERLREVLDSKSTGETVAIGVLRRGERLDMDVGFAEESEERFYASGDYEEAMDLADEVYEAQIEMERTYARLAEVQAELHMAELALVEAQRAGQDSEEAREEVEERRADVEDLRADLAVQEEKLERGSGAMRLLELSGGGRALVLPPGATTARAAPLVSSGEVDERLRAMEERLSRLEDLLKKLVESDVADK